MLKRHPRLRRFRHRHWVRASPGPTWSTLIRVRRLNHRLTPAGTGHHSGRHTPCAVSLILYCSSHVGRTTSRPGRPGIAEAPAPTRFAVPRWDRFQGTEYRSFPLPSEDTFPGSAPRLCCRLLARASSPLSWLSSSRSRDLPQIPGRKILYRPLGVTTGGLPTPARVKRTCPYPGPVRIPPGGFEADSRFAPTLN